MSFVGGLLDWVGDAPPDGNSVAGARVREAATAHVATIAEGGGAVTGHCDVDPDGSGDPTPSGGWGIAFVRLRAERLFVKGDPPPPHELRDVSSPLTDDMLRSFRAHRATVQFSSLLSDGDLARLAEWLVQQPHVSLRAYGSYDHSITDLEFLRHFPRLRRFSADALYGSLTSIGGVRHLPTDLEELGLGATKVKADLGVLQRFSALKRLFVEGPVKGIDALASLTCLEELTLRSITLPDLSPLLPLHRLRALDLKLGGTRDLSLLPQIGELEYLELWMVRGLCDIAAVGQLRSLRYLFLESLRQVAELPDLSGCRELRRVHLQTMKGLTSLEPLMTAPALQELVVFDAGHLQPEHFACLRSHPTLRAVTLGLGSRKKTSEVEALLGLPHAGGKVPWRTV